VPARKRTRVPQLGFSRSRPSVEQAGDHKARALSARNPSRLQGGPDVLDIAWGSSRPSTD
jgi:hypothetical protein